MADRRLPVRALLPRLALTATAVLLASCAEAESSNHAQTTETTVTTTVPTTNPPVQDSPEIEWDDCGGLECATVAAPLDYEKPDGETIDIYVTRIPATGERHGALWMNFGGPGASAADRITSWPVPAEVTEHFDLVGMDPRGVGRSAPLDCGIPALELYAPDPTIDEPADTDALIDTSQRYVDDCATRADVLPHLGTRNVARDMDLIRSMMGDERIDFVGYSYGSVIGQTYADLFPERIRTMVIDGIVDPELTGPELAEAQGVGFEKALQRWAEGCAARGCTLDDPLSAVDRALDLAEGGLDAGNGRTLGPGEMAIGLVYPLYSPQLWPALDDAIDSALSLDGSAMYDLAVGYSQIVDFSIYFAVSCLDSSWPATTDELLEIGEDARGTSPRFGEAVVNDYIRCPMWPTEPDPLGALSAEGAPPILVVSTTGDAATPHENALAVTDRIDSAVLLTHEGEGHTIVFQGNECVDRAVVDYIVEEKTPAEGTTC